MVWPIAGNPCSIEAHGIGPDGRTVDHLDAKLQVKASDFGVGFNK